MSVQSELIERMERALASKNAEIAELETMWARTIADYNRVCAQNDDLNALLLDVICQACSDGQGEIDSGAISSYADAIRYLDNVGRMEITANRGRRVIAKIVDGQ